MDIAVASLQITIIIKWVETWRLLTLLSSFESFSIGCHRKSIIQGLPNMEYFAVVD